jgi:sec-independent protein translocase protein TatC
LQGVADDDRRMTIVEHLEELRRVLIISAAAWLIAAAVAFVFRNQIIDILLHPILPTLHNVNNGNQGRVQVLNPLEPLTIAFKVAAVAGVIGALPVITWQVWNFVSPGLRPVEKRFAAPFFASSLLLFAAGATFAYFVMPLGLNFLANFLPSQDIAYNVEFSQYLNFFMLLIVIFGVTFEMPIVLILLGMLGIVSSRSLRRRRRAFIIGIIFAALIITPGADPFTPTALAIPLIIFFEASILVLDRLLHR